MKSRSLKTARNLALLASLGIFLSCTATPERVSYSDTVANNETLKTSYTRIKAEVQADCAEGLCEIAESNITALVKLINGLQDDIDKRVEAHNKLVDALTSEEMESARNREARQYCEIAAEKTALVNMAKNLGYLAICAGGIIWR